MLEVLIIAGFEKNVLIIALQIRYEILHRNPIDLFSYHPL